MTEIDRNRRLCNSPQFARMIRRKPWVHPNVRRIEYAPMIFEPEKEG